MSSKFAYSCITLEFNSSTQNEETCMSRQEKYYVTHNFKFHVQDQGPARSPSPRDPCVWGHGGMRDSAQPDCQYRGRLRSYQLQQTLRPEVRIFVFVLLCTAVVCSFILLCAFSRFLHPRPSVCLLLLSLSYKHTLSLTLVQTHTLSLSPTLSHTHTLNLSPQCKRRLAKGRLQ